MAKYNTNHTNSMKSYLLRRLRSRRRCPSRGGRTRARRASPVKARSELNCMYACVYSVCVGPICVPCLFRPCRVRISSVFLPRAFARALERGAHHRCTITCGGQSTCQWGGIECTVGGQGVSWQGSRCGRSIAFDVRVRGSELDRRWSVPTPDGKPPPCPCVCLYS